MSCRKKYYKWKSLGLCPSCGHKKDNENYFRCNKCVKDSNRRNLERTLKFNNLGLCRLCGKNKDNKLNMCDSCRRKENARAKQKVLNYIKNKLCITCAKPAEILNKYCLCRVCWFKRIASSRTKNIGNWEVIKNKLENQNYICFYSGRKLIIGKNASLDHIIPKTRGGSDDINNLHWIDITVNKMKNNMNEKEFYQIIKDLYNNIKE